MFVDVCRFSQMFDDVRRFSYNFIDDQRFPLNFIAARELPFAIGLWHALWFSIVALHKQNTQPQNTNPT